MVFTNGYKYIYDNVLKRKRSTSISYPNEKGFPFD